MTDNLKVLSLFAGIGGFDLGLERAGMEIAAMCESDAACRNVLKKHWPKTPVYTDVRALKGAEVEAHVGPINLICGGYPCQPYSHAGMRRGFEDDRDLWPEMFRLIGELRPAWVIGENVAGHVRLGLDRTLSDLEGEGYATRAFVIPACAVDAPHRRDRVWIVAHTTCRNDGIRHIGPSPGQEPQFGDGPGPHSVRDTASQGLSDRTTQPVGGQKAVTELKRPNRWRTEPCMDRVADGVPGRVDRLKQLGNAIVPQLAQKLGTAIQIAHKESRT